MRAIAVFPGKLNSAHMVEMPRPSVDDFPDGSGVLVKVLRVGIDGTDTEINEGSYGEAPAGSEFLVTGHESLGRVEDVGESVGDFKKGDLVGARSPWDFGRQS